MVLYFAMMNCGFLSSSKQGNAKKQNFEYHVRPTQALQLHPQQLLIRKEFLEVKAESK